MTTIAYRDGVLAADQQVTCMDIADGRSTKIAKRGRIMAGATGNAPICRRFLDWFRSGMKGDQPSMGTPGSDDSARAVIFFDQTRLSLGPNGWNSATSAFFAEGSGWELAIGAMAAGATAEEAILIAIEYDVNSGGPVTVLRAAGA